MNKNELIKDAIEKVQQFQNIEIPTEIYPAFEKEMNSQFNRWVMEKEIKGPVMILKPKAFIL